MPTTKSTTQKREMVRGMRVGRKLERTFYSLWLRIKQILALDGFLKAENFVLVVTQ